MLARMQAQQAAFQAAAGEASDPADAAQAAGPADAGTLLFSFKA